MTSNVCIMCVFCFLLSLIIVLIVLIYDKESINNGVKNTAFNSSTLYIIHQRSVRRQARFRVRVTEGLSRDYTSFAASYQEG